MAVTDGIMLLGSELGFGMNAFVGGLVGLHMLALCYWLVKFLQESSKTAKYAAIKKRQ
ncbi:hypothetical protein F441_08872 [Phytophthora nicotianae CJ01A1]|uniref:Uncharacterized protein n=6 Tax=Phytophthora nicotianae TaxID=4792 RepID=W2Q9H7_PHYN3|nr:hypothetical protein PPTG_11221 [Phytophthora nicotianae INRA-310]ETI46767.1 hypothetical protein F443_08894 [Phytophthora nicotianae P1569]ETK86705.1 hypothetical protein L915_08726 [Phytophthora nicotianae]ETO75468.1 hypothetical protein F444_08962 [Phytophthora nicotianae P1976]ETP16585.1 hypothetical protein F441_08872 [Phytophthora nicotianae CJ01A1]ETP44603.1 hypothetical protein F442_08836 [Phytophthora nicotianae P10297]KUF91004.1 hypothetical protein AM587_10008326 [Phytophthora n